MQYSDFQKLPASEKITLCILKASRRLMGWTLHSGSIYKIGNLDVLVDGVEDSGFAYTQADSIATVTASKYFYDINTKTLYLRTTGSDNPNGRFIVLRQKMCYSNVPIILPHDLNSGDEVQFVPILKSTSQFGTSIDVIAQDSEAIEGSGTIVFHNDFDFWPKNYDRLFFDNHDAFIYSYHRDLAPSDAFLIYKGKVEKRAYTANQITLNLKDQFLELRAPLTLNTIDSLGERTGSDIASAYQRMILGRVSGHRPVNLDQVLDGYPLTGTVNAVYESAVLTGVGTKFLTELSPDDQLTIANVTYTVATVLSDTSLNLTENFAVPGGLTGQTALIIPERPKRFMNREWLVAGHPIREPLTATQNGSSVIRLMLDDTSDIRVGDSLYIGELGSGEIVKVESLIGDSQVKLSTSLARIPPIGTKVRRPGVQNVRINDVQLVYFDDYTFDAETARLTLRKTAESNSGPIRQMTTNVTFTTGSRTVTGTGFRNTIFPGYMIGVVGNLIFFEVLSVESDTSLTLRSASTFTANTTGRYQSLVFDPNEDVLTLDALGKTDDGTAQGKLLRSGPDIVRGLLKDAGLGSVIDNDSFDTAGQLAYEPLGLVVPTGFGDTELPTYRDLINSVNKSTFCSLIQNARFEFAIEVLRPTKPQSSTRFTEADILSMEFTTTAENMVKTAIVTYAPKEYDYLTGKDSISTVQKSSKTSTYILKTMREKTITTYLADFDDARTHANRWAYILENTAGRITFTTKLQGMQLEIGDIIEVEHRKLFQRFGGVDNRRLMFVESAKKSGSAVEIEATDLSNSFNRIATITNLDAAFNIASADDKLYGGYITDPYGLIDNNPDTTGTNLIW